MDQNRNQSPGNEARDRSGTSGWSPTSQPGPASGSGSIHTGSTGSATGTAVKSDRKLGDIGDDVREGAQHLRERAMERGGEVMEQVQSRVNSAVEQGKSRIADQLESVCDTVDEVADRSDNQSVTRYAHMASERLHGAADYLRNSDPAEMVRGAQRLARRHPDVFLGSALVAGLLIGRFLRAHEPRQDYRRLDRDFDRGYGDGFDDRDFDRAGAGAANIGANIGSRPGSDIGAGLESGARTGIGGTGGNSGASGVGGAGPGIGAASTGIGPAGQKPSGLGSTGSSGQGSSGGIGQAGQNKRDQNPPSQPRF